MSDLRADYDVIGDAANGFTREADRVKQLIQQLKRAYEPLQQTWVGQGAKAFFADMETVLRALSRLEKALRFAGEILKKIAGIFQTGEQEGSGTVSSTGSGSGGTGSGGESSGAGGESSSGAGGESGGAGGTGSGAGGESGGAGGTGSGAGGESGGAGGTGSGAGGESGDDAYGEFEGALNDLLEDATGGAVSVKETPEGLEITITISMGKGEGAMATDNRYGMEPAAAAAGQEAAKESGGGGGGGGSGDGSGSYGGGQPGMSGGAGGGGLPGWFGAATEAQVTNFDATPSVAGPSKGNPLGTMLIELGVTAGLGVLGVSAKSFIKKIM